MDRLNIRSRKKKLAVGIVLEINLIIHSLPSHVDMELSINKWRQSKS